MALLKCIECGHEVSEYADACPSCGCPMSVIKQMIQEKEQVKKEKLNIPENHMIYKGFEYDFSDVKMMVEKHKDGEAVYIITNKCGISWSEALTMVAVIGHNNNNIPANYEEALEQWENYMARSRQQSNLIKCPYCGSTDIKAIGFFDGGWSAVGNNWKCKKCKSCF